MRVCKHSSYHIGESFLITSNLLWMAFISHAYGYYKVFIDLKWPCTPGWPSCESAGDRARPYDPMPMKRLNDRLSALMCIKWPSHILIQSCGRCLISTFCVLVLSVADNKRFL